MRCKFIFLLFVVSIFLFSSVGALGVSPAFKDYNFEPGLSGKIKYTIFAPDNMDINLSLSGDLAEYFKLDKEEARGPQEFNVEFKLPNEIKKPGLHRVRVSVAQKIDPELATGFIGTRIVIISVIDVYVPYPGRYLETVLNAEDVNVGEPVKFVLDISSEGKEDVTVSPTIEVYSDSGAEIDVLSFTERNIKSQEKVSLQKFLETTLYNPGKYKALSIVDYGELAKSETEFRVGNLSIEMVGYTNKFYAGKLQKFNIGVESGWNDLIDGVYADVKIFNQSGKVSEFKTSTADLAPWEAKNITGYLDATEMFPGDYSANITLIYFGKDRGVSQSNVVDIILVEEPKNLFWFISNNWYLFTGGGIIVLIIVLFIVLFRKIENLKKGSGNGSRQKKK